MFRFVDQGGGGGGGGGGQHGGGNGSDLVDFSGSQVAGGGNSPMCHNDSAMFPPAVDSGGGRRCDNIDWLPKFRAGYKFTPRSSVINAFAVRAMDMPTVRRVRPCRAGLR